MGNRPKLDPTQMSLVGESVDPVTSVQWITAQENTTDTASDTDGSQMQLA